MITKQGIIAVFTSHLLYMLIAIIAVALPACATMKTLFSPSSQHSATARVVVQVAVFNLITEKPEYKEKILAITKTVKAYLDEKPSASVTAVVGLVNEQIHWDKLKPDERMLVQTLMAVVEMNLTEKVNDKTLPADLKVTVGQLISWIESVVQPYSGAGITTDENVAS